MNTSLVRRSRRTTDLRIGIIDLMPSAAGAMARRQFGRLIESAAPGSGLTPQVVSFAPDQDGSVVSSREFGIDWEEVRTLDMLIVTGAEPKSRDIESDPTLKVVDRIIDVSCDHAVSTLYSCFSAHAAISLLYSVQRTELPEKRSGIFEHHVSDPSHPLVAGLPPQIPVPHSRWNQVRLDHLVLAGIVPLVELPRGDWHLASSPDGLRHVFLQGHPEYEADTLFREYKRDVRRFVMCESERYPPLPTSYFDKKSVELLTDFQCRAQERRDFRILESFPTSDVVGRLENIWDGAARIVIHNWLSSVTREN